MEDETKSAREDNLKITKLNRNKSSLDDLHKDRHIILRPLTRNKLCRSTKNLSVSSNFYKSSSMFNRNVLKLILS